MFSVVTYPFPHEEINLLQILVIFKKWALDEQSLHLLLNLLSLTWIQCLLQTLIVSSHFYIISFVYCLFLHWLQSLSHFRFSINKIILSRDLCCPAWTAVSWSMWSLSHFFDPIINSLASDFMVGSLLYDIMYQIFCLDAILV